MAANTTTRNLRTVPRGTNLDQGLWGVWDHETADYLTDRDGNDTFDYSDARDLEMEHRG
jgi:hypothetical protein